ncbi:MAG: ATP-dependent Clp protease ATP-binding subunit, partial [Ruminococcus sp.]|nr:ATP-dependent Clp protease ATP-binding subunit [Ruminococcus sp.]
GVGFNKTDSEISHDKAMKALKDFLRPEFLGRIDEIVVFNPLTEEDYAKIADLMLGEIAQPLDERGIKLRYDDEVLKVIAHKSYDQKLGARDIRRVIRNEVEDRISEFIVDKGDTGITAFGITVKDNDIVVDCL